MRTYIFDGSFDGILTAVFESYEFKEPVIKLVDKARFEPVLIDDFHEVISSEEKSQRVWKGLQKRLGKDANSLFSVFLSEDPAAFQLLFDYCRYLFDSPPGAEKNYGHPAVIGLQKMERIVSRERHRMKAFIRFQQTADGLYYAPIDPDFNVLPLIIGFFRNRFKDQPWLIYDLKRHYGVYYDKKTTEIVDCTFVDNLKDSGAFLPVALQDEREQLFATLWKDYFRSTNIAARRNMKLHIRHVPKRYWKYLTEKAVG